MTKKEFENIVCTSYFTSDEIKQLGYENYIMVNKKILEIVSSSADAEIKLKKEVEYWKKSFNKQVQSSRGGYQPIKLQEGKPIQPPGNE